MKIECLTKINNGPNPRFTSNNREVYGTINGAKKLLYRTNTCFFRDDLRWNEFADFLIKKYQNTPKVNVYSYGCSEGAEPFSLAMLLIEKLGKEKAKKFFPIIASDIDSKILENPKKGIITPSKEDLENMGSVLGSNYTKYITFDSNFNIDTELEDEICKGRIKPILQDTVIFKKANFIDDLNNIEPDNSIIICKNFLNYYNNHTEQRPLIKRLGERLNSNSFCLLGDFDGNDMIQLFEEMGFKETAFSSFLLEKKPAPEKNFLSNPFYLFSTFIRKK